MKLLVTGATGGIGSHIVEALAGMDVEFFLHYVDEGKRKIAEERFKKTFSNPIRFFKADLTKEAETERMADALVEMGGVDIVIHCVSLPLERKELLAKEWVDFDRHIALQAKSLFQLVKRLVPLMKERRAGRIVCIVSEAVVGSPPVNLSDYVVAKYALLGLCKCIASEYGRFNIRCNALSPGFIETNLTKNVPDRFKELAARLSPHKRLMTPKEVGEAVKSLCFDSNAPNGKHILLNVGEK